MIALLLIFLVSASSSFFNKKDTYYIFNAKINKSNYIRNPLFDTIIEKHRQICCDNNMTQLNIPMKYSLHPTLNTDGIFSTTVYSNSLFRKVRISHLEMPSYNGSQMLSIIYYPELCYDIPILQFEMICFENKKSNVIMNMIKMNNNKYYNTKYVEPFMHYKKSAKTLNGDVFFRMSKYILFDNFISEAVLVGLFKDPETMINNIMIYHENYINTYIEIAKNQSANISNTNHIKSKHELFDKTKYNLDSKSPIAKYFDKEWYFAFLKYLYQ